jgi:hypothetical protein
VIGIALVAAELLVVLCISCRISTLPYPLSAATSRASLGSTYQFKLPPATSPWLATSLRRVIRVSCISTFSLPTCGVPYWAPIFLRCVPLAHPSKNPMDIPGPYSAETRLPMRAQLASGASPPRLLRTFSRPPPPHCSHPQPAPQHALTSFSSLLAMGWRRARRRSSREEIRRRDRHQEPPRQHHQEERLPGQPGRARQAQRQ